MDGESTTFWLSVVLTVLWAVITGLALLDPRKGGKWTKSAFVLFVCLGLVIISANWQSWLLRRDAIEASQQAKKTLESAEEAAKKAEVAAEMARVAATNAKQASEVTTRSIAMLASIGKGVERAASEVVRTSEPLEEIGIDVRFFLPMSHPEVTTYKLRLDTQVGLFKKIPKVRYDKNGVPTVGLYGQSIAAVPLGQGMSKKARQLQEKSVWFTAGDSLFPAASSQSEDMARRAFSFIGLAELAFYKSHIDPKTFAHSNRGVISSKPIEPRPNPPDLSVAGQSSNALVQFRVGQDEASFGPHTYRLWIENWKPPKSEWFLASPNIKFVGDLPETQLLIVVTRSRPSTKEARSIRQEIEIERAKLYLNKSVLSLSSEDFKKRFDADGNPVWEYVFPKDFTEKLSPGV